MVLRRDLIAMLGGAAAAWPAAVRAQQKTMPVIGLLRPTSPPPTNIAAFRQGLAEAGYVEGQDVAIEYRWAEVHNERLPALAADLVRRPVAAIAAISLPAALAAKAATATIPIVFAIAADPVEYGLVTSLARPGGNLTGFSSFNTALGPKRLGLLRELVPDATVIGLLVNSSNSNAALQSRDAEQAAGATRQQIIVLGASTDSDIDSAFATLGERRAEALIVAADVFSDTRRARIVELAARYAVPTIFPEREFADAGGLISYANSIGDGYHTVALYIGKILKGARPADLPVQRSTKFELVINLKTAKVLGVTVPPALLTGADEVIELPSAFR